jgi:hypothetical protein
VRCILERTIAALPLPWLIAPAPQLERRQRCHRACDTRTVTRFDVEVQEDHIQRLIGRPLPGLAELIWNALDADADHVHVRLARNELGGLDAVIVEDDGHGMSFMDASTVFKSLGGSWKQYTVTTRKQKRRMHGAEGKGRFRAFGIPGERVRWETIEPGDSRSMVEVITDRSSLRHGEVRDPTPTDRPSGTRVLIEGISDEVPSLASDQAVPRLTSEFALYLGQYPSIEINYDGISIDPSAVQKVVTVYDLSGVAADTKLTVIEWSLSGVDRLIHLCTPDGVALSNVRAGVHAPGFEYSAYLASPLVREFAADLGLAEPEHPVIGPLLKAAQDQLREHFRRRAGEEREAVIEEWKREKLYPYEGEPQNAVEEVKREVFDAVATDAAAVVNAAGDPGVKRLSLHLIREALETGPTALRRVFKEVLNLPAERLAELDELLDRTTLSAIISASRKVTDRLDFVASLEALVFDEESKETLRERSQLHRIIAAEPWIFGEEYALAVDDQSLTTVLRKHIGLLDRTDLIEKDQAILGPDGRRRVDLMLARAIPQRENFQHHLVVELKRPSVTIGAAELTQISQYADTVEADERFDRQRTKWDFYLISNSLDDYATRQTSQQNREPGEYYRSGNLRVWAVSWSQVIQDARHRLKFVQDALDYMASGDTALAYLRRHHKGQLPDAFVTDHGQPHEQPGTGSGG